MKLSRLSQFTGNYNVMEIPLSEEEYELCYMAWTVDGVLLQDAFPNLTAEERDFIKFGVTPEEWEAVIGVTADE